MASGQGRRWVTSSDPWPMWPTEYLTHDPYDPWPMVQHSRWCCQNVLVIHCDNERSEIKHKNSNILGWVIITLQKLGCHLKGEQWKHTRFMTERSQVLLVNQCTASSSFKKLPQAYAYYYQNESTNPPSYQQFSIHMGFLVNKRTLTVNIRLGYFYNPRE